MVDVAWFSGSESVLYVWVARNNFPHKNLKNFHDFHVFSWRGHLQMIDLYASQADIQYMYVPWSLYVWKSCENHGNFWDFCVENYFLPLTHIKRFLSQKTKRHRPRQHFQIKYSMVTYLIFGGPHFMMLETFFGQNHWIWYYKPMEKQWLSLVNPNLEQL